MSRVNQLAAVIEKLFDRSRDDGKQRSHTTEKGLKLTVSTYPDTWIALSRASAQPSTDEAVTVAKHAGWGSLYSADWENIGGKRYLVLRPDYSELELDPEPEAEAAAPAPPPDVDGPSNEAIRALLLAEGPWHAAAMSLQSPPESREKVVQGFKRCQLLDWLTWVKTKFPTAYVEYQAQH